MPRECTHPDHPVTRTESVKMAIEMAENCKEVLGGFSSEGIYDYLAPYLDYGLYGSFGTSSAPGDRSVPFAELGITPEKGMEMGLTFSINSTNEEDISKNVWKNITYRCGGGVIGRNDWSKIPAVKLGE